MISKYAKLVEMLTRNFIKAMRRQPNNLENLKIKQQAAETIRQEQKIIPFKYKKTFGKKVLVVYLKRPQRQKMKF
jgi:hypothetical protein